ncbi:kelch repeat protein [Coniochaeta ligniaria NRRL 30616]|uniref:Kelch repeat protein n=1 Tax=Coniochaeta ligniaria NRRL 30616 TaxID=1408157 RepID=A0A1J7J575_9PEZI|nr:kelch repeat protein [Coniochaeta ligniaria NRRL 30616]
MANLSASWTRLASSERLGRSSQSLSVLGSQAWVFGGELLPREPVDNRLDVVELKSPAAITLKAPTKAPGPRVGVVSVALKGALYLFSGRGGLAMAPVEENGALWRYTPNQSLWDLIEPANPSAPYPAGRSYHSMTSDGNDTIYIHAGCPEKGRLSDLWSFNVESNTWTELPAAPPPARGGGSITFSSGKLYRMNGFDGKSEQGGAIDVLDLATHTWSTISFAPNGVQGPEPRSVSTLLAVKMKGRDFLLTLFGERDPSSLGHAGAGKMLADVWAFDLERKEWTKVEPKGDTPLPRGWFSADVMVNDNGEHSAIIHGGLAEDNSRLGDVWKLQFD